MPIKSTKKYIAGLDVGTNTVYSIIASENENGQVNILGTGTADSHGVKCGIVVDIDDVVSAVIRSVEEAEDAAGVSVEKLFLSVNGAHILGANNSGNYHLERQDKEINSRDVSSAIALANNIPLPDNHEIIHSVPRGFVVDGIGGVKNPVGMLAETIEARAHVITGASNPIHNLIKAVNRAGFDVEDLIFGALASSNIVSTNEEKELGSVVVNLGAGTTCITVYKEGHLIFTEVLAMGGDDLTQRLSEKFRLTRDMAEDTKRKFSGVAMDNINENDTISVNYFQRGVPVLCNKLQFCGEIREWVSDMFCKINESIDKMDLSGHVEAGVILTGGGALIRGVKDLARECFGSYVRLGSGRNVVGLDSIVRNPGFSTIIGVAKYSLDSRSSRGPFLFRNKKGFRKFSDDILNWFRDLF